MVVKRFGPARQEFRAVQLSRRQQREEPTMSPGRYQRTEDSTRHVIDPVDIFDGDHHCLFTRDRIHQVNNRRGYSVTEPPHPRYAIQRQWNPWAGLWRGDQDSEVTPGRIQALRAWRAIQGGGRQTRRTVGARRSTALQPLPKPLPLVLQPSGIPENPALANSRFSEQDDASRLFVFGQLEFVAQLQHLARASNERRESLL